MNHTPWTQEDAEKWAKEETFEFHGCFTGDCPHTEVSECGQHFFLAGLAMAAEMIEASPSIYCSKPDGVSELWTHNRCDGHDTHSAKLVGVRPIEGEK